MTLTTRGIGPCNAMPTGGFGPYLKSGGSGGRQPGGFKIGLFQSIIKYSTEREEDRIEIPGIEVKERSIDYAAEIARFELGIELIKKQQALLESQFALTGIISKTEQFRLDTIAARLAEGRRMLELVRKRRSEEEEIIAIIAVDD